MEEKNVKIMRRKTNDEQIQQLRKNKERTTVIIRRGEMPKMDEESLKGYLRYDETGQFKDKIYNVNGVTLDLLEKRNSFFRGRSPENLRKEIELENLIKTTINPRNVGEKEEVCKILQGLSIYSNSVFLGKNEVFSEIFQSTFKPEEVLKLNISKKREDWETYLTGPAHILYGFVGHYLLNSFGFSRRIFPTLVAVTDPITRSRIRIENRAHPHCKSIYFTNEFNMKTLVAQSIQRYFDKNRIPDNQNLGRLALLKLIELMLELGLYEVSDLSVLVDQLSFITSVCTELEKLTEDDDATLFFTRELIICIMISIITLINDTELLRILKGGYSSKSKNNRLYFPANPSFSKTWHQMSDLKIKMTQTLFEFALAPFEKNPNYREHLNLFADELFPLYTSNELEPFEQSLKLVTTDLLNDFSSKQLERENAIEAMFNFQNSCLRSFLSDSSGHRSDQSNQEAFFEELFNKIVAFGVDVLARGTQISAYLIGFLAVLKEVELEQLVPKAFDLLEKVVCVEKYAFVQVFSKANFFYFKEVGAKYTSETITVIQKAVKAHGSSYIFSISPLMEWILCFFERSSIDAILSDSSENTDGSQKVIRMCRALMQILEDSSISSHPLYEEVCARLQWNLLDENGYFYKTIWPALHKKSMYANYNAGVEQYVLNGFSTKDSLTNKLIMGLSLIRLINVVTLEFQVEEIVKWFKRENEFLPTFMIEDKKLFLVLCDFVALRTNFIQLNHDDCNFLTKDLFTEFRGTEAGLKIFEKIVDMLPQYGEFIDALEGDLKKEALKKGTEGIFIPILKFLKERMAFVVYISLGMDKKKEAGKPIENLCHKIQRSFSNFSLICDILTKEQANIEPFVLPPDFRIPIEAMDSAEMSCHALIPYRVIVSHTTTLLQDALEKSETLSKRVQRDFTKRHLELEKFMKTKTKFKQKEKKKESWNIDLFKGQSKLLAAFRTAKESNLNQDMKSTLVEVCNTSIGIEDNILSILFSELKEAIYFSGRPTWRYSSRLYVFINFFSEFLLKGEKYKRIIFEKDLLLTEVIPAPLKKQVSPSADEIERRYLEPKIPFERGDEMNNNDSVSSSQISVIVEQNQSGVLLLDRLHILHKLFFKRVCYSHLHSHIFKLWRERYLSISNLFQNLCERNYMEFKELFGTRVIKGGKVTMAQKMFSLLTHSTWILNFQGVRVDPFEIDDIIPEIKQAVGFLTELVIGPCKTNQEAFSKDYETLTAVIMMDRGHPGNKEWELIPMFINFFLELHEGQPLAYFQKRFKNYSIETEMAKIKEYVLRVYSACSNRASYNEQLKKGVLKKGIRRRSHYLFGFTTKSMLMAAYLESSKFANHPLLMTAFKYFELLSLLSKKSTLFKTAIGKLYSLSKRMKKNGKIKGENQEVMEVVTVYAFIRDVFRTIEIVDPSQEGGIRKIYFATNPEFHYLTSHQVKKFMNEVNLEDRNAKFIDLFEQKTDFFIEMSWNYKVKLKFSLVYMLFSPRNLRIAEYINFMFGLLINLLIVLLYKRNILNEFDAEYSGFVAILIIIAFSVIFNIVMLVGFCFIRLYPIYRISVHNFRQRFPRYMNKKRSIPIIARIFDIGLYKSILAQTTIQGNIISVVSNLTFYYLQSPFCLVFQLAQMVNLFRPARFVVRSITEKLWYFISTFIMAIFLIYGYALIVAEFIPGHVPPQEYIGSDLEIYSDQNVCQSMLECLFFSVRSGLLGDAGLGSVLNAQGYDSLIPFYLGRFIFDISFYIAINVLILNIVGGIVIDSFAELRDIDNQRGISHASFVFITSGSNPTLHLCGAFVRC